MFSRLPRKKGSVRSKFGEWIDKELGRINENNCAVDKRNLCEKYTQEKLADAANIVRETMSRYCTINKDTGCPKAQPSLHTVIKIIAVLGVAPNEAYEALRLTMHCIDAVDSYPFLSEYYSIINDPKCKSKGMYGNGAVVDCINEHLENAVERGGKHRGDTYIYKVFVQL